MHPTSKILIYVYTPMTIAVYEAIFESARAKWKWSSHNLCPPHPLQKEIFFFSGSQLISQQQSHVSAIRTVSLSYMSTMSNKKSVGSISSVSVPVMLVKCVSHEKNIFVPPVNHVIPLSTTNYYYHNRRASNILSLQKNKKWNWDIMFMTYPRIRNYNFNLPMGRTTISI